MSQIDVYNIQNEKVGTLDIKDEIFNIDPNMDVLYRYVDMQLTNKRAGTASTKTRSEVRGGGRKPWPQKHLGRARAGSIRSPIFRHGGVAFGPKPREFHKDLNKKMKRLALKSALSVRYRENNLIVLDDVKFEKPRTKDVKNILTQFGMEDTKVLFLFPYKQEQYENFKLSARNLPKAKVIIADNPGQNKKNVDGLNVFDLINNEKIVLTKEMVNKIEEVIG